MSVNRFFSTPDHSKAVDAALLLLRLVAGLAFALHGWGKIQHPFNWMGPDGFAPAPLQALAAISEFGGGLAWILGLLTPLASFGVACTMAVATWTLAVTRGDPFVASGPGPAFELPAVYLCVALLLIASGAGRWSLDRAVFGKR
ncbi:MAG: DoxX family protein [Candidatus Eisenbacteria bacterium]